MCSMANDLVGSTLGRIGTMLLPRADEVADAIEARTRASALVLDDDVETDFRRIGIIATVAIATWMIDDDPTRAREVGDDAYELFARLALDNKAALNEVVKRCLRWRDSVGQVVDGIVDDIGAADSVRDAARRRVQRSLDVTIVRVCETFELARQRVHDELALHQHELALRATHDALTGLPNRALLIDRGEQMLARARRERRHIAALFVDVDNFKKINDTLGHAVGDELLVEVARRLADVVRESDTVGRLGGDEFVVLTESADAEVGVAELAERVLDVLRPAFHLSASHQRPLVVTASIGATVGLRSSAAELVREADIAMYRAKTEGKNRYVMFESGMHRAVQDRLALELALHHAVAAQELAIAFQPTVSLHDMSLVGAEALLRWRHPLRGAVPPSEFVPLLEEHGMISAAGRWVLIEACRAAARWRVAGLDLTVEVNVSARQLDSGTFDSGLDEALEVSGLAPGSLLVEITERQLLHLTEASLRCLDSLRGRGVRIAIDDFGTGHSSMSDLRRLPIDRLKIDGSFVSGIDRSPQALALIRSVVQLGRALELEVLAEGVERTEELAAVRAEGCDLAQGHLFSMAVDAAGMAELAATLSPLV